MSGEAGTSDWLFTPGDDLAVGPGMPRTHLPWYQAARPILGELAGAVDETAHLHMMEAFYRTPRATMRRIPDGLAIQKFFPTSGEWTPFMLEVDDPENLYIVPIAGDPDLRSRISKVREVFRRPRVISFDMRDVTHPLLDQMITCFDGDGAAIGSLVEIQEAGEQGAMLTLLTHEEALRKIGASVFRPRSNEQLAHLLSAADSVLGPESEFARETGNRATIERQYVFEDALHTIGLIDTYRGKRKTLNSLYAICASPATESLLGFCDSEDEIEHVASIVKKRPPWLMELCRSYNTLRHDTITAGDPEKFIYERPLEAQAFRLGHDLMKTALLHHDDVGFRQDYLDASLRALYDTLNALHAIDLPARLPKEQDMYTGLADFATSYAGDAIQLSLIAPVVEQLFLLKLKRIIPGEFEKARDFFYKFIGSALNAHSNEATGDDEQQLQLLTDVFDELVTLGYWHEGDILQDAGAGRGDRILRRFLLSKVMQKARPGYVYAVDALFFDQPGDRLWDAVQMQFEDDDYPHIHAKKIGARGIVPIDAITETWSSPSDVGADKQQAMFEHFSRSLKKREGNTPGGVLVLEVPIGYINEMIAFAQERGRREMGEVTLHYPIGDGKTLDKPLEIMKTHDLIIRAMRAGFRPLNLPPGKGVVKTPAFYRTGAGKDRGIFVFERVGDPEPTLDAAALGDGQILVGSARPDKPI